MMLQATSEEHVHFMAATKTRLPPAEHDALKAIIDAGGTDRKVPVAALGVDKKALNSLKARDGFSPSRYSATGTRHRGDSSQGSR
jgi:hypothetical protein